MDDLRSLPKVDVLSGVATLQEYPARVRVDAARQAIDDARDLIRSGTSLATGDLERMAVGVAKRLVTDSLRPAINMSGVILHTGLGRARLAASVAKNVERIGANHSTLEFDEETGRRGDRQVHVRGLLTKLTGAEDGVVVNNAAAGVIVSLAALSRRKEVILSRGQMVEIGGSFRMPDIVKESGCRLVELGTTNKTRLEDYERALSPRSKVVLRCHPSNYQVVGFTE